MRLIGLVLGGFLAIAAAACAGAADGDRTPANGPSTPAGQAPSRITESFDHNWRFFLGDAPDAANVSFNDAAWRTLDVPHDWSIEGPFDPNNATGPAGAYLPAGVGWYRKHFTLPAADAPKKIFIDFDGVMANSDVWINGFHLGKRPYGYVGFRYDLTGHLNFGTPENVLAVRADNSNQPASRWYAGAGIYRHVRLVAADPVHLEHWSTFVTTPTVNRDQAIIHVASSVINQSATDRPIGLRITILDPNGQPVQSAEQTQIVPAGATVDFAQDIPVTNPQLWDIDHPMIYTALSAVRSGAAVLDDERTPFGIRTAEFDAAKGFLLNGQPVKIKGACLHQDAGAFGVAVPLGAWEKRFAALKAVGCNAIRTSHNPVAPEFLDLADRMGFLIMDETFDVWTQGKDDFVNQHLKDYHLFFRDWWQTDLRDTIRRDRNHPSIIIYSAGNEIRDVTNAPLAFSIFKPMHELYHELDPTRPVTMAVVRPNGQSGQPNPNSVYENGFADLMDVVGQNYRETELIAAHEQKPTRKVIGTENGKDLRSWRSVRDNAFYSGQFLWAGFDYLGESRRWPVVANSAGVFDRTSAFRASSYERQSYWTTAPMVRVFRVDAAPARQAGADRAAPAPHLADWTPRNPDTTQVNLEIYTTCERVELRLNGKSLGEQPRQGGGSITWRNVPYAPGILQAIGKNGGAAVCTDELHTAGKAAKIALAADRSTLAPVWDDVAYITATVVDENGIPVPSADQRVHFTVSSPGLIAAVDNADPASHESFRGNDRQVFGGQCVAIIKAANTGQIEVSASAEGLTASSVTLEATAPK